MATYPSQYDNPCICEVCGKDVEGCICTECPTCHVYGDPKCACNGGKGCEEVVYAL